MNSILRTPKMACSFLGTENNTLFSLILADAACMASFLLSSASLLSLNSAHFGRCNLHVLSVSKVSMALSSRPSSRVVCTEMHRSIYTFKNLSAFLVHWRDYDDQSVSHSALAQLFKFICLISGAYYDHILLSLFFSFTSINSSVTEHSLFSCKYQIKLIGC